MDKYELSSYTTDRWEHHEGFNRQETVLFLLGVNTPDKVLLAAHSIMRHVIDTLKDNLGILTFYAPTSLRVEQEKGEVGSLRFSWNVFHGYISLRVSPKIVSLIFKKKKVKALGIDLTGIEEKKIKKEGKHILIESSIDDYSSIRDLLPKVIERHTNA